MSSITFSSALPAPVARPAQASRPSLAAPAPALSRAEEAQIANAFPARPTVAQRLYGPDRQTQTAPQVGGRLDLSA